MHALLLKKSLYFLYFYFNYFIISSHAVIGLFYFRIIRINNSARMLICSRMRTHSAGLKTFVKLQLDNWKVVREKVGDGQKKVEDFVGKGC